MSCSKSLLGFVSRVSVVCLLALSMMGLWLRVDAHADVWKYVDGKGVTFFTNQPPAQGAQRIFDPVAANSSAVVSVPPMSPGASAPALGTASAPAAGAPVNPTGALGDWPPRPNNSTK